MLTLPHETLVWIYKLFMIMLTAVVSMKKFYKDSFLKIDFFLNFTFTPQNSITKKRIERQDKHGNSKSLADVSIDM